MLIVKRASVEKTFAELAQGLGKTLFRSPVLILPRVNVRRFRRKFRQVFVVVLFPQRNPRHEKLLKVVVIQCFCGCDPCFGAGVQHTG